MKLKKAKKASDEIRRLRMSLRSQKELNVDIQQKADKVNQDFKRREDNIDHVTRCFEQRCIEVSALRSKIKEIEHVCQQKDEEIVKLKAIIFDQKAGYEMIQKGETDVPV